MLAIKNKRRVNVKRLLLGIFAAVVAAAGLYTLTLTLAPAAAPLLFLKPINVQALPAPAKNDDRIVIPKLGINLHYDTGAAALDRGAEWRSPKSGNPLDGGNFVIAAHRFSIQPTPMGTIEKSPFYSIDKLEAGDKILIDYLGKRYGYEITKTFTVQPTQIEIEARTNDPIVTLYSCELGGADGGRFVIQAKRLGEVSLVVH